MKKILVAIDYSHTTPMVMNVAGEYARALNAKLCLAHVLADTSYYTIDYGPVEGFSNFNLSNSIMISEEIRENAEKSMHNLIEGFDYPHTEYKLLEGSIQESLLEYALEWGADLIVVGSHNHTGLFKLINGETSVRLVHHSSIPLLIVPEVGEEES